MSAPNLPGRMPGPGVDLNKDYTGDDYDRTGCVASIAVTRHGYILSIFAPNGARMESYRGVKRAEDVARMLREWCEGKVPRLPAPIKTPTESREAA